MQKKGYDHPEQPAEKLISQLPVDRTIALAIVDAVERAIDDSELPRQAHWKEEIKYEYKMIVPYIKFLQSHRKDEYNTDIFEDITDILCEDEYNTNIFEDITGIPLIRVLEKRFELLKNAIERVSPDKTLWWQKLLVSNIKRILEGNKIRFSTSYKRGDEGFQLLIKTFRALEHYPWPNNKGIQMYQLVKQLYSTASKPAHNGSENSPKK